MNRIARAIAIVLSITFGLSTAHADEMDNRRAAKATETQHSPKKKWGLLPPQSTGATWCAQPLPVEKKDGDSQEARQQTTSVKKQQVTISVVGWSGDKITIQTSDGKEVAKGTARPVKIDGMWDAPRATLKLSLEPGNYRVICQLREEEERIVPQALRIAPTKFVYTVRCP